MNKLKTNHFHFFFLLLIIINYSLSLYLFNGFIFLTTTDLFDSELLFNKILGEIYRGDYSSLNHLLDGQYKWFYFTRIFFLINFFYSVFSPELAYLFIDLIIKIFAYISFFKLSKIVGNNNTFSFLLSSVYAFACTTAFSDYHSSIFGFGASIIPYLTYLVIKNKNIKFKNYFFIIFAAINSHFYFALTMFFFPMLIYFYKKDLNLKLSLKVFILFTIFCILANINILYIALFNEVPLNRDTWVTESISMKENIISLIRNLFYFPNFFTSININNSSEKILYFPLFFKKLPILVFYILAVFLLFFKKIKNSIFFVSILTLILLTCFLEKTQFYTYLVNNSELGVIKSIQLSRIKLIMTFIILFIIANLKEKDGVFKNITFTVLVLSIFLFQTHKILVPFTKDYINYAQLSKNEKLELKQNFIKFNIVRTIELIQSYSNQKKEIEQKYLTFKDYYDSKNFLYVKNIVKDSYVLPIDMDPAKLIFNNIKVLGGYFQFYPTSYKNNFREIIADELEANKQKKMVFDTRGHRLYAFVNDPNNIKLNLNKAKSMKANFIISSKKLSNKDLIRICEDCNSQVNIHLYSIK